MKNTTDDTVIATWRDPYELRLQDPRWLAFRDRIFEIDRHQCILCGTTKNPQGHHDHYHDKHAAWEYSVFEVATLCDRCHKKHHALKEAAIEVLVAAIRKVNFDGEQILKATRLILEKISYTDSRYKTALAERNERIVNENNKQALNSTR